MPITHSSGRSTSMARVASTPLLTYARAPALSIHRALLLAFVHGEADDLHLREFGPDAPGGFNAVNGEPVGRSIFLV